MAYVDNETLRLQSSLREVQDADDETLAMWGDMARAEIDQFCNRDFDFEVGVEKSIWVTGPFISLPKEISNITHAEEANIDNFSNGVIDYAHDFVIMPPANTSIRYHLLSTERKPYPIKPRMVKITADWGMPTVPVEVQRVYRILIDRIAARNHEDDRLQVHAPYAKQSDGDGYDYDLGNGTLRNLLRPEDRAQLWKWVNHGRLIA